MIYSERAEYAENERRERERGDSVSIEFVIFFPVLAVSLYLCFIERIAARMMECGHI